MSNYDDHDWYEDGECPHCGGLREYEHDDTEGDRDDTDDEEDPTESRLFERAEIVAEKALVRCGMTPGVGSWNDEMAALVRRLAEQADDPLERRVPGWTVAPPF